MDLSQQQFRPILLDPTYFTQLTGTTKLIAKDALPQLLLTPLIHH
jgi:hypothetical protein